METIIDPVACSRLGGETAPEVRQNQTQRKWFSYQQNTPEMEVKMHKQYLLVIQVPLSFVTEVNKWLAH